LTELFESKAVNGGIIEVRKVNLVFDIKKLEEKEEEMNEKIRQK
jgi:hypothetical protein